MDLIILCGGEGKRLKKHIEKDTPKSLAKINGIPFLDILMNRFERDKNISKIILAVGYLKEKITKHCFIRKFKKVIFSKEKEPLGTGGALKKAMDLVNSENVFVLNGDSFLDFSIQDMKKFHLLKKSDITICCVSINNSNRFGKIEIDEKNRILSFKEKEKKLEKGLINAGVYLINKKKFFEKSENLEKFSLEKDFFQKNKNLNIFGYFCNKMFIDIGVKSSYFKSQKILKKLCKKY